MNCTSINVTAENVVQREFLLNTAYRLRTSSELLLAIVELLLGTKLTAGQEEYLSILRGSTQALLGLAASLSAFAQEAVGTSLVNPGNSLTASEHSTIALPSSQKATVSAGQPRAAKEEVLLHLSIPLTPDSHPWCSSLDLARSTN